MSHAHPARRNGKAGKARRYEQATRTASGYAVQNIKWNNVAQAYIGQVADPTWATPERPFTSATWDNKGHCRNRTRPDCDLVIDPD